MRKGPGSVYDKGNISVVICDSPFVFVTEPIQSRCAVLRYSKLTDQQVLKRLLEVCESEKVSYTDDGLEAIVFTAQGDMRQVTLI